MTEFDKAVLESEFVLNPTWDYLLTKALSERLQINRIKIYKWHYDRVKRSAQHPILTVSPKAV